MELVDENYYFKHIVLCDEKVVWMKKLPSIAYLDAIRGIAKSSVVEDVSVFVPSYRDVDDMSSFGVYSWLYFYLPNVYTKTVQKSTLICYKFGNLLEIDQKTFLNHFEKHRGKVVIIP